MATIISIKNKADQVEDGWKHIFLRPINDVSVGFDVDGPDGIEHSFLLTFDPVLGRVRWVNRYGAKDYVEFSL